VKITNIHWHIVENALTVPFVTSLRRVERLESLVLVFETDDGLTAAGGAAPTKAITGEDLATLQTAFAGPVQEVCLGADPADHEALMARLTAALPRQSSARAAVSIALFNQLAAAPGTRFRLDPNQGWTQDEARRLLTLFREKELPIDFVEQPLPAADLAGMASLRRAGLYPVVADESVFSPADAARVIDAGSADILNIKLMKTGGLGEALAICRLAQGAGLGVMVGSMLEGAASVLAAIHLAYADPAVTVTDLDAPLLFRELPEELTGVYRENGKIAFP
jgi:L-alanine-DL-glutamate epimerase-like enolase superfamily enzyme